MAAGTYNFDPAKLCQNYTSPLKCWLAIVPLVTLENRIGIDWDGKRELTDEELKVFDRTNSFVDEYRDVFENLSK